MDSVQLDTGVLWIAAPWTGGARSSTAVPYFRKAFTLSGPAVSASLTISAFGLYEAELNGCTVGDEIFAPGWTDYNKRVQYQIYEVGALLQIGENVLGAMLGDGWYCGHVAWQDRQIYGNKPWLLAQLTVFLQDGSVVKVFTDDAWKTTPGPILESDLVMGEIYDARLELDGWSLPGYDDHFWQSVVCGNPQGNCEWVPRSGPPVRRIKELHPVEVREFRDGEGSKGMIFDFGQNFSGRAKIRVKSAKGANLKLRFAEILDEFGNLYTENLRGARATDFYTCRGSDFETWEPRFTFHGFRYLEVIGLADSDCFEVTGIVLHSDLPVTGSFCCSNPLLNQLQSNIQWGQRGNFLEVPTDCPQRDERLGWTGDAQVFVRTAAFNMNIEGFFTKWMRDVRDVQHPNGAVPVVAPMPGYFRHIPYEDGGPAWSDAIIICPWTLYLCYGNGQILRDNYDAMKSYMDFLAQHRCCGFVRSHPDVDEWGGFGDWLALDGSGRLEGNTPKDLIGTAFYAYNAGIMNRVASILGLSEDAAAYEKLRKNIGEAFRRRFMSPEGLLASRTQTAYVLTLYFDLVSEESRAACTRELVRLVERNDYHLATGFVGTPYLLDVLETNGYPDIAYRLLEQETSPSWLFPVKNGATTIWERWNGWIPGKGFEDKAMNSFNHYAYGAVGAWLYQTVAGLNLDPEEPGYRHIIFRPRPGGSITWAEATLETAFGQAAIRWELDNDALHLLLTVPEGARATLLPPCDYQQEKMELSSGKHGILLQRRWSDASFSQLPCDDDGGLGSVPNEGGERPLCYSDMPQDRACSEFVSSY